MNTLFRREFHVSRSSRERYQFDQSLFALTGNVIFANFRAAREFAHKMNAQREQTVRASDLNAMGLIDEILHLVVQEYREQKNPQAMNLALTWLAEKLGRDALDKTLRRFTAEFPPLVVYRHEMSIDDYLRDHRESALEEMLMLWLANANPAFAPFVELFDDANLERDTAYLKIPTLLHAFFETQPRFGPDNQNLIDMLRAPALASHTLQGQLDFLRNCWRGLSFMSAYLIHLLSSLDFIGEESRGAVFLDIGGPTRVPVTSFNYAGVEYEPERFSPDLDWMPHLVLVAKNIYVWLDQLSKKYRRALKRLDQIPDEELDQLARWGFTGLWMIGVWERSHASKNIKQMMGNPDAVASAYSLFDYRIADALGGEAALQNLKARAWQRGIRLASDMVPNHMGIDSTWVVEHPDWFLSLDHSPFPAYTFNGPDWSWDSRVGIYLEDHYFNHSDAAVVFKRVDKWTGDTKYIYHGNDGTSFPWNDTAQLNYLQAQVREAVIQTILHVARQFPVIRFDAAMTLAKKHYQRLWFPEPGTGSAIPSRAEFGLTRAQFDAAMPEEFWREVVDRVAREAPDTLLLAEAFWLMEGYFVRTLGMHRVYNSAFMNMLRNEDNAKYRQVIKNTLEFDPEVLKRYVNFMNNPDEKTAVEQFGKGDKYLGICTLMVTLPGLPMFGHGQVEGFAEKYGMEYQRAYYDEQPDGDLVYRHEREIFPLSRKRYLFSGVENFLLYDFFAPEGGVNEDVFAYSNRAGSERSLVVYNNKLANARGWIRTSAAFAVKTGNGDDKVLVQKTLSEGLGLRGEHNDWTIFRDAMTGLEYIRNSNELRERGLYLELGAYGRNVFLGWREVRDENGMYARLASMLNGRGTPSIDEAARELVLQPVLVPFREIANVGYFKWLLDNRVTKPRGNVKTAVLDEAEQKMLVLLRAIKQYTGGIGHERVLAKQTRLEIQEILNSEFRISSLVISRERSDREISTSKRKISRSAPNDRSSLSTVHCSLLFAWAFTHSLARVVGNANIAQTSRAWLDEWLFGKVIANALRDLGVNENDEWQAVNAIKVLITHRVESDKASELLEAWMNDTAAQQFLRVNRHNDIVWFNKEGYEQLVALTLAVATIENATTPRRTKTVAIKKLAEQKKLTQKLALAEKESKFQVDALLAAARKLDAPKRVTKKKRTTKPRPPKVFAGKRKRGKIKKS